MHLLQQTTKTILLSIAMVAAPCLLAATAEERVIGTTSPVYQEVNDSSLSKSASSGTTVFREVNDSSLTPAASGNSTTFREVNDSSLTPASAGNATVFREVNDASLTPVQSGSATVFREVNDSSLTKSASGSSGTTTKPATFTEASRSVSGGKVSQADTRGHIENTSSSAGSKTAASPPPAVKTPPSQPVATVGSKGSAAAPAGAQYKTASPPPAQATKQVQAPPRSQQIQKESVSYAAKDNNAGVAPGAAGATAVSGSSLLPPPVEANLAEPARAAVSAGNPQTVRPPEHVPYQGGYAQDVKGAVERVDAAHQAGVEPAPADANLVHRENNAINRMRYTEQIPEQQYQSAQSQYDGQVMEDGRTAVERASQHPDAVAAGEGNIAHDMQPRTGPAKSPTDTDNWLVQKDPDGPLVTSEDVVRTEEAFHEVSNERVTSTGARPFDDAARQLDSDFLPTPEAAGENFPGIHEDGNARGATGYTSAGAGNQEMQNRNIQLHPEEHSPADIDLGQAGEYVGEMHNQTQHQIDAGQAALQEGRQIMDTADPDSAAYMDGESRVIDSDVAAHRGTKYVGRTEGQRNAVAEQHLGESVQAEHGMHGELDAAGEARLQSTSESAQRVMAVEEHVMNAETRATAEVWAEVGTESLDVATDPNLTPEQATARQAELRTQAQQGIGEMTRDMSPSARGEVVDAVHEVAGPEFAAETATEMANRPARGHGGQGNPSTVLPDGTEVGPRASSFAPEDPGMINRGAQTVQAADAALAEGAGIQMAIPEGAGLRAGANRAVAGGAAVAGAVLTANELGHAAGEYVEGIDRAMDPNTTDAEAEQGFQQAERAADTTIIVGTLGAAAEAAPFAAGVPLVGAGAYLGTRHAMETSENPSIQKFEEGKAEAWDEHVNKNVERGAVAVVDGVRQVAGYPTSEDEAWHRAQDRRIAYARALNRGEIIPAPGVTPEQLHEALDRAAAGGDPSELQGMVQHNPDHPRPDPAQDMLTRAADENWAGDGPLDPGVIFEPDPNALDEAMDDLFNPDSAGRTGQELSTLQDAEEHMPDLPGDTFDGGTADGEHPLDGMRFGDDFAGGMDDMDLNRTLLDEREANGEAEQTLSAARSTLNDGGTAISGQGEVLAEPSAADTFMDSVGRGVETAMQEWGEDVADRAADEARHSGHSDSSSGHATETVTGSAAATEPTDSTASSGEGHHASSSSGGHTHGADGEDIPIPSWWPTGAGGSSGHDHAPGGQDLPAYKPPSSGGGSSGGGGGCA